MAASCLSAAVPDLDAAVAFQRRSSPALVDLHHGKKGGVVLLCDLDGIECLISMINVRCFLTRSKSYLHGPGPDIALRGER